MADLLLSLLKPVLQGVLQTEDEGPEWPRDTSVISGLEGLAFSWN